MDGGAAGGDPVRRELRSTSEPEHGQIGRVVDAWFGQAVAARIDSGVGPDVMSDARTGRFHLSSRPDRPTDLRVAAWGFHPRTVPLSERDPGEFLEIRLEPSRTAAVVVEYADGTPAQGLSVVWSPAVASDPFSRWNPHGRLDVDPATGVVARPTETSALGRAEVRTSQPVLAIIEDPPRKLVQAVQVLPNQELRVVLSSEVLTLRVVDFDTRKPRVGFELAAWFPRNVASMPLRLVTDADGFVRIAASSWPILLRRPGSAVWQTELVPLSDGLRAIGFGGDPKTQIQIDSAAVGSVPSVGVRSCGPTLRLVDRETGEPIHGPVRLAIRDATQPLERSSGPDRETLESPRSSFPGIDEVFRVHAGALELPCTLHEPQALLAGTDPGRRLVLFVAGYRPYTLEGPLNGVLELTPAVTRVLRVLHSHGAPAALALSIYSPEENAFCLRSLGSHDGIYGPFEWFGGPLLVQGSRPAGEWWIPARWLEADDVVTLTVPAYGGSLVVQGIPAVGELPWIATLQHSSTEFRPSSVGVDTVRFDHLPSGSYLVGPRDWVQGAELLSMTPSAQHFAEDGTPRSWRHPVEEGGLTVVQWEPSWAAGRDFEGRVRLLGAGRIEPVLVPFYAPGLASVENLSGEPPTLRFGRNSPRIPVDRDGTYRLGSLDPLPFLIVICATDETVWGGVGGLHVLDVIRPGESLEIATASVELHWKSGAPKTPVRVEYETAAESHRYPVKTFHGRSRNTWAPGSVLRLDGIPLHVNELRIAGRRLPVQLTAVGIQRIDLALDDLALPERR